MASEAGTDSHDYVSVHGGEYLGDGGLVNIDSLKQFDMLKKNQIFKYTYKNVLKLY